MFTVKILSLSLLRSTLLNKHQRFLKMDDASTITHTHKFFSLLAFLFFGFLAVTNFITQLAITSSTSIFLSSCFPLFFSPSLSYFRFFYFLFFNRPKTPASILFFPFFPFFFQMYMYFFSSCFAVFNRILTFIIFPVFFSLFQNVHALFFFILQFRSSYKY